jgi:hypothetical protein
MKVRSRFAKLAVIVSTGLASTVVLAGPAGAVSALTTANCRHNFDNGAYTMAVGAPKIWSRNGGTQSVRFRTLLEKWNGSRWALDTTGVWHTGTATPNRPFQASAPVWSLNSHGAGYYKTLIQVQYLSGGVWGSTESGWYNSYGDHSYDSVFGWQYWGQVGYCTVYSS